MLRIRRLIAAHLALLVVVLTLGLVRVDWTGAGSAAAAADPGRPVACDTAVPSVKERS